MKSPNLCQKRVRLSEPSFFIHMEAVITSIINSVLASGTLSEAHIILGIFVVTIIALRRPRKETKNEETKDDITDDLEVKTLESDITALRTDIELLRNDIQELRTRLDLLRRKF